MANDLEMWELAKHLGNGLDIWFMSYVFEKRHKYVGYDLNTVNVA